MADAEPSSSTGPPVASPAAIWAARLAKELPQLSAHLPQGVSRSTPDAETIDLAEGVCRLRFELLGAPEEGPQVIVEVELGQAATNYPFQPPVLRVLSGRERLPAGNVEGGAEGRCVLPALARWTPNTSVLDLLADVREALARGPGPESTQEGAPGEEGFEPGQALNANKLGGPLFPCTLQQQGGGVLHRYVGVTDDWVLALEADRTRLEWVVVVRAQPMLTVAKIKYKRGESIAIIFKDTSKWELQMAASAECVQAIQGALARKGVNGRKTSQAALNQVDKARALVQEAQRREQEMAAAGESKEDESEEGRLRAYERVLAVQDLYRDAIELLSSVSDEKKQTEEVLALLHAFYLRPDVQIALEHAPPPPPTPPASTRSATSSQSLLSKQLQTTPRSLVPKALGQMMGPRVRGEVLPRSESEVYSQEDDGLAREERNLLKHGLSQLRRMMDLGLGLGPDEPEGAGAAGAQGLARQRTGSGGSVGGLDLSTSGGSGLSLPVSGEEEGGGGGDVGRVASGSVDASLQDLEGLLARATSEFAKLSSPEKEKEKGAATEAGAAATTAAAAAVEAAAEPGPDEEQAAASSHQAEGDGEEGQKKGSGEAEEDEEEVII